jgi:CHAD domain-containing protein
MKNAIHALIITSGQVCCSLLIGYYNRSMRDDVELTTDMHIAELGRRIMADQLAIMELHRPDLQAETSVTAVHETRKAIRRTYTAVRLFRPYFEPGLLNGYRKRLRKLMKRLAPCRDTAVFLGKLQGARPDTAVPLDELAQYWQIQKAATEANLRLYLTRPKWTGFWDAYAAFTATDGKGVRPSQTGDPVRAQHVIPVLLYQRVAAIWAYDDFLHESESPAIQKLHQLRIQCKELRYAFEFFAPLLGAEIVPVIEALKQLQVNLGDLNDARVALMLLEKTPGRETAVRHYQSFQQAEISRLRHEFWPLWAELNAPAWRQNLAAAVGKLRDWRLAIRDSLVSSL